MDRKNGQKEVKTGFSVGTIVSTPGALKALEAAKVTPMELLLRHIGCDWAEMDPEDILANTKALMHGGRIFSAYTVAGTKFWVITEADRSSTTILLPSEY